MNDSGNVKYVKFGRECNYFIMLPASANIIEKIANGMADDLLTSTNLNYTGGKTKKIKYFL